MGQATTLSANSLNSNNQRFWMLSRLDDWLPPWRASVAYASGQGVVDPNGNVQIATTPGISNATQPTWNTNTGATTQDQGVTWTNNGPDTTQSGLHYCNSSRRLQLRSMRTGAGPAENFNTASTLVQTAPMTLDQYGNYARWDASAGVVAAGGSGPGEVPLFWPPQPNVTDLVMGYDGVLYVAAGGSLVLIDQRGRWQNFTLTVPGFSFWRLGALPGGGVLALDNNAGQLGKVAGLPLQTEIPADIPNPGILQPCAPNANPPRLVARSTLPAGEYYVALAPISPSQQPQQFALLSWATNSPGNTTSYLRLCDETAVASTRLQLGAVQWPYAVASLGDQKLAILATGLNEALIYDLENVDLSTGNVAETLGPAGDTYILSADNVGPMVHGFNLPPHYTNPAWVQNPGGAGLSPMLPLVPLSLNSLAATGATNPAAPAIIDSGIGQNVWHRLFIEAVLPARTGAIVWLTASDTLTDISDPSTSWYPHTLGTVPAGSITPALLADAPTAVLQSIPTEVPCAPTLLGSNPQDALLDATRGLFMALVQRAGKAVRNLSGRFLGVRIALNGDGRNTPQIAGIRIYGPRFSYVQNYLPQIYHENRFGAAADAPGPSTHRDFFERFVNQFEAQFTRIEDRIAKSYLLTRPDSTPDDSLPWLGGWVGVNFDHYPPQFRRARLQAAPQLNRRRGTLEGITQALDVATGGMCTRGAIIVIEDFRLRHIFATILGADLSDQNNPLLPGFTGSSNSFVGDTLFLGDPGVQAELQALFANDLDLSGGAQAAQAFYDQLAMRLTVFIHKGVEDVNLNLVSRIVEAEKPAHVLASVRLATQPLMIGLASLLGVNTYLAPEPASNPATVGVSDVGRYDVVTQSPSLDPRMENGATFEEYALPIARIKVPPAVPTGGTITLDGSTSSSPTGTTIVSYQWTLKQPN